ncbi:MAG: hypothetical protein KCHDKBKB_00698 [Elusimicrobia bacterium]|nr:hypothetical protein [Elusimicrobiota bacterium]
MEGVKTEIANQLPSPEYRIALGRGETRLSFLESDIAPRPFFRAQWVKDTRMLEGYGM